VSEEAHTPVSILPSVLAEAHGDGPFVAVVRTRQELCRWLNNPLPDLRWLQVEGMLGDPEAWTEAAHGNSNIPFDVVVSDPALEFSHLYRLVDAYAVRAIRVTMPAAPGLAKAIRLAAALRLPVRVLPGQPSAEALEELNDALQFYLHEPTVEAPVEFFHSVLASMCDSDAGSLWTILEEDPDVFRHYDADERARVPRARDPDQSVITSARFVEDHLSRLIAQGAECATCPWQRPCSGYFKWSDPAYSCEGVKQLFFSIQTAANEIRQYVASFTGADRGISSEPRKATR
jgi:hypothetical protein